MKQAMLILPVESLDSTLCGGCHVWAPSMEDRLSILVFAHVFGQCGRHCQCHCSRLGQLGWWCDTDLHDLRAVQSHGGIWHGGCHGLASVHDRSCGVFFLALCCCDEALVLGHSQCQALRCGCHWQDPEAVLVGLCGSPKRCSRACDDLSVFCWL